jgi:hypothetical protein
MSGCAAHHMALSDGQSDIDVTKKSIALLSVKTSNQVKAKFQFDLVGAIICPQSEPCSNPRPYLHKANDPVRSEKNSFNEYLLSFELAPGKYTIKSLATVYVSLVSEAGGYAPVDMKFDVKPNTVSYLGHIDVILRDRTKDSEKAAGRDQLVIGPVVRVEDKRLSRTGFASGVFDVIVEDRFDEDMKSFKARYPALRGVAVEKAVPSP